MICSTFPNRAKFYLKCKISEESISRFPEVSLSKVNGLIWTRVSGTTQVKCLRDHSKVSIWGTLLQHQETGPCESILSVPGSILGKANRKSRRKKKKETFRAHFGPLCIPFLSITRLILRHRCSFWMSEAAGRCFPLNPLSLPLNLFIAVSLSACTSSSYC